MHRIRSRLAAGLLVVMLLLASVPTAGAAAGYDVWPEMEGELAVRFTVGGAEATRVMVGDTFKLQFWINGIDPYSMLLPISWDSAMVRLVNDQTGAAVQSGRKTEADVGDGFRPGASCYDPSYGGDFLPLYWNGKPIYSTAEEGGDGYPYIDSENGHCRFLYYVDASTSSAAPQMFLELTFEALQSGEPGFHFSTTGDRIYDPAAEDGLTLAFPGSGADDGGVVCYTGLVDWPALRVITSSEEGEGRPNPDGGWSGGGNQGGQSGNQTEQPEELEPETPMVDAVHLTCFPYEKASYTQAVVRTEAGQAIQRENDYILPASVLASAINQAVPRGSTSIVVNMPDRLIDKEIYTVSFPCGNLDDMANRNLAMLYFETPYGYVGVNPAGLLQDVSQSAELTLTVSIATGEFQVSAFADGKELNGFTSPVLRIIVPCSTNGGGEPMAFSSTLLGSAYAAGAQRALPISRFDGNKGCLIFLTPIPGAYSVREASALTFADVPEHHWAHDAVAALSAAGIVGGTSAGVYSPDAPVTRGQFAVMAVCTLGTYQTDFTVPFADVRDGMYYYPYIGAAHAVGIVGGRTPTAFAPDASISRQDIAVLAYRGLSLLGAVPEPVREAPQFTDEDQMADYAVEAVTALYRAGIIDGLPGNRFDPNGTTTRAAAAKIAYGIYEQVHHLL